MTWVTRHPDMGSEVKPFHDMGYIGKSSILYWKNNPGCKHHLYRNDSLGVRYGHSLGSRGQIWSHQVDTRPHRVSVIGEWLLEPKVVLHGMWGHNPGCKHHLYRSDSYRYIEVRYDHTLGSRGQTRTPNNFFLEIFTYFRRNSRRVELCIIN